MARRSGKSKKTVTVHLDARTLRELVEAIRGLSDLAEGIAMAADDPALRRQLTRRPKRRAKRSARRRS